MDNKKETNSQIINMIIIYKKEKITNEIRNVVIKKKSRPMKRKKWPIKRKKQTNKKEKID